jgi:phage-related tail fiber protein
MPQFYTVLTQTGQNKMANAIALGTMIEITALAVGDGGGSLPNPTHTRTALVNEVRRAPINRVDVDGDNPNWLIVEQVLPPDVGGWTIREVGLFDADGDLIGYGNYPETFKPTLDQGSGRTLTIRMVLEVTHTAAVTLRVDPSVVLATRKYVDDQRVAHEAGRAHPLATETERGMVVRASQTMVNAGEDDEKFVSSKKLKDWAAQWVKQATETVAGMLKVATQEQVDNGASDETAVTPKKLRWNVAFTRSASGYLALPSWLGGIIIQWGRTPQSVSDGNVTANFPIQFPNQCFSVTLVADHTTGIQQKTAIRSARDRTPSGFQYGAWDDTSTRVGGFGSDFIAIGW